MDYQQALDCIFEGNCTLILGSGFSAGCEIANGDKMPRADKFCALLDSLSEEASGGDLGLAAEQFLDKKGKAALCELLREQFTPVRLDPHHKIIAGQEWRRVYTTNYDDIIEQGGREVKKRRIIGVSMSDHPEDFVNKRNLVVHLNGHIQNLSLDKLDDELKLTKASYLADQFNQSKWIDIFNFDLRDSDAIFIVGMSLDYDLDIARMVFREEDKQKIFIIVWDQEKPWNIKKLQKYGTVLNIGVSKFANDISEAKESHIPISRPKEMKFESIRKYLLIPDRPQVTDETVRRLLLWGQIDEAALQFSILEPENYIYFIYRDRIAPVVEMIENDTRDIVVHSLVGNGKTMFVKGLATILSREGYEVFILHRENKNLIHTELEAICSIRDKRVVLIIEDYTKYKPLVEEVIALRSDLVLILTDRTPANDLNFDWLKERIGDDIKEINLNRLSDNELEGTIRLIDSVNIWGDLVAEAPNRKERFIREECRSELRSVLLKIFNTKPIKDHLKEIFGNLSGNIRKSTILLLMANYSSFRIDLYDLAKAINYEVVTSSGFQRSNVVNEFLDFSTGECKASSALLAEFVLKNFVEPRDLCDTLIEAFKEFDKDRWKYGVVLKSLCRHSTLLSLIGHHSEEARNLIPTYYDNIKNCRWCRKNPHFWLQYAIAMLDQEDYPEASLYFKNAYALSKDDENFNRIQIDNHFARYLLENANKNDDDQYWESFIKAHQILTDPRYLKDKKYYPYKVGVLYQPFYEKYKGRMNPVKLKIFKDNTNQLLEMLEKYIKSVESGAVRKDVAKAKSALEAILRSSMTLNI